VSRESTLRISLWLACPFNLFAAAVFAMPASALGRYMGLPAEVPALYVALVALFVGLFGLVYGWLAAQPLIDRPLLWLGSIGKLAAFAIAATLWLGQALPFRTAAASIGDLAFALIWLSWLRSHRAA
jgi:asparagine N-glycosylation enzyme membrane subunit Stt3